MNGTKKAPKSDQDFLRHNTEGKPTMSTELKNNSVLKKTQAPFICNTKSLIFHSNIILHGEKIKFAGYFPELLKLISKIDCPCHRTWQATQCERRENHVSLKRQRVSHRTCDQASSQRLAIA